MWTYSLFKLFLYLINQMYIILCVYIGKSNTQEVHVSLEEEGSDLCGSPLFFWGLFYRPSLRMVHLLHR